jgi:methyl-accepting chemotaxis protein
MKLNIRTKLLGGFFIIVALSIGIFGVGFMGLNAINDSANTTYQNSNENYLWQQWKINCTKQTCIYLAYLSNPDQSLLEDLQQTANEGDSIRSDLAKLVPPERKQYFDTITTEVADVSKVGQAAISAMASKDMESTSQAITNWKNLNNQIDADTNLAIASAKQSTDAAIVQANQKKADSTRLMIIIGITVVLLATGISLILSQSISRGIGRVKKALQKMATGDLTEKANIKSGDEIGSMARAYNETQTYLNKLVAQLKESAVQLTAASKQLATASEQSSQATQQVATSSQQMAKGAQEQSLNAQETSKSIGQLSESISQLAKGANEQSAGVQKAVASITEVSQTMSQVAEKTNLVAQGARQAAESARTGAEKTNQTLAGIEKIRVAAENVAKKIAELGSRSTEIGKIVAVIDEIAAQTNLLALNAAIEAARAGEQGRGFAVVSDEVRKLAERSATATKEIADLIGSIQKGVDEATKEMAGGSVDVMAGCKLAEEAGHSLAEILESSTEVNSEIEQISAKAQQVNGATLELVKVIDSVGTITEENSAVAEQMAANATQVTKSVETVAGIAEENSAATEEVSASAQQMNAQAQEIVASSQTLQEMAANLEQSVAMFKVAMNDQEKVAAP